MFKKNLCMFDRCLRGIVALVTLGLGFMGTEIIGDIVLQAFLILFGVLNMVSLLAGWCMVYQAVGINTCKNK